MKIFSTIISFIIFVGVITLFVSNYSAQTNLINTGLVLVGIGFALAIIQGLFQKTANLQMPKIFDAQSRLELT